MDAIIADLLRRHPMLGRLGEDDWRRIGSGARSLALTSESRLYRRGDAADHLYLIVEGTLALRDPDHPATGLGPLGMGEVVGTEALAAGGGYGHDAVALSTLVVWPIAAARLIARLEENFDDALAMIAAQAAALRIRVKEIAEYKMQSSAERLANYLVDLAGADRGRAVMRLPDEKRMLARRLGMDPATLSRSFAKLRHIGVEASRGDEVTVADLARLAEFANRDTIAHEDMYR